MSERKDVALDAAMDKLTRTTPPMDQEVAARLLLEAREIFVAPWVAFFPLQGDSVA